MQQAAEGEKAAEEERAAEKGRAARNLEELPAASIRRRNEWAGIEASLC
jgi:hypothetical protein